MEFYRQMPRKLLIIEEAKNASGFHEQSIIPVSFPRLELMLD